MSNKMTKAKLAGMTPLLESAIRKVPLGKMKTSTKTQRDLREPRVAKLVAEMDIDQIGIPVLSERDGDFFIIDGQHRIEALRRWLGTGSEKQLLECRVYQGLNEQQEADIFDRLNDTLTVSSFDKFRVRVAAGRDTEQSVLRIVASCGLHISKVSNKTPGAISCVTTLRNILIKTNEKVLRTALVIARDAFGDAGMEATIVNGLSQLVHRYGEALDVDKAIEKLSGVRGGASGMIGRAIVLQKQLGNQRAYCFAAACVDVINSGQGGKKLPSWWRSGGSSE